MGGEGKGEEGGGRGEGRGVREWVGGREEIRVGRGGGVRDG